MPDHVLQLCRLPTLRKFYYLFRTEELARHVEDISLFFLNVGLDMLFEHLKLLGPGLVVRARHG